VTASPPHSADARMSYIYVLVDPETRQPRYVGKTWIPPEKRLYQHVWGAKRTPKPQHRDYWIRTVLARGLTPEIEVIESGVWSPKEAYEREIHWIQGLRNLGVDLTNMTDGGEGNRGGVLSEETRRKIREAGRRRWERETAEEREARRAKHRATWRNNPEALKAEWADPECKRRKTLSSNEYRSRRSAIAKEVYKNLKPRQCIDCGYTGKPIDVGAHLRETGHAGYLNLTVQNEG
jgi:hypothetical protein